MLVYHGGYTLINEIDIVEGQGPMIKYKIEYNTI